MDFLGKLCRSRQSCWVLLPLAVFGLMAQASKAHAVERPGPPSRPALVAMPSWHRCRSAAQSLALCGSEHGLPGTHRHDNAVGRVDFPRELSFLIRIATRIVGPEGDIAGPISVIEDGSHHVSYRAYAVDADANAHVGRPFAKRNSLAGVATFAAPLEYKAPRTGQCPADVGRSRQTARPERSAQATSLCRKAVAVGASPRPLGLAVKTSRPCREAGS